MTGGRKKKDAVEKEETMTYADMFSKVKGMLIGADVPDNACTLRFTAAAGT